MVYMKIKHRIVTLLRLSERYTKTDMLYLASGAFWLTIGQAVASVSAFALSIVFANFLSPQVYGTYKYILSLGGIAAIPTLTGVSTALQRAVARGEDRAAMRALRAKLIGGIVTTVGALVGAVWYFTHGNTELGVALTIVALGTPLMEAFGLYDNVLQGKGRFKDTTFYYVISSLIATVALISAIFVSGGNLVVLLFTYFGIWTIARMVAWQKVSRNLTYQEEATPGEVVVYGVRLSAIGIISTIAGNIDKIILYQWLGPAQLAVYAFATAMPEQLRAVLKGVTPLALSRFSRRSAEEIRSSIHHKAVVSIIVALPLVAAYIIAAPFVYQILFPAYIESIVYSQIFALSVLVVPVFLYTAALQSQRAERIIAVNDIVLNLVQIALLLVMIPYFGIWGAIWARVIGRYLGAIVIATTIQYLR